MEKYHALMHYCLIKASFIVFETSVCNKIKTYYPLSVYHALNSQTDRLFLIKF